MPTVRDFYKFIWSKVDEQNIKHPNNPNNPVLNVDILVTVDNEKFLQDCEANSIFEVVGYSPIKSGSIITLERNSSHPREPGIFFDHKDALNSLDLGPIERWNFYLGDINYDSTLVNLKATPEVVLALSAVADIIKILESTKNYGTKSLLVFFSKNTLEIDKYLDHEKYDDSLVSKLASHKNVSVLKEFSEWFYSEKAKSHLVKKKSIISARLFDILWKTPQQDRLLILLCSIVELAEHSMNSYELYLEDFSYSRFSKRLEEKTIEYYEKISKSILDIRNQVIGLPISFIVLNLVKENATGSIYIFGGVTVYCVILFILLYQQKIYILDIEEESLKFTNQKVESQAMKTELDATRLKLSKRIQLQKRYILFFQVLVALALFAALHQYSPDIFQSAEHTSKKIEYLNNYP